LKKCFKELDEYEALKGMQLKLMDMLELGSESTNFDIVKTTWSD
jgi:hypothetical protein